MKPRHYRTGPLTSPFVPSSPESGRAGCLRGRRGRLSGTCGDGRATLSRRFVGITHQESFDPSLWFLALEGDEIAGITLCKTLAGEGWVDVVGVRRPWRNRGLGLALLRHAFTEYHRRGTHKVGLSVDAESITGAPRLYGRAGMRVRESYIIHLKELRPGVDLGVRSDAD